MTSDEKLPLRVLFVCTQNSARSQIAEALLNARKDPRVVAGSAGTKPAARINPFAIELLESRGIDASRARPKDVEEVIGEPWDLIITVCDAANESCPVFPGLPTTAHWGVPDPAAVAGDDEAKRRAFRDTAILLGRRIDLLLALPFEELAALALERRVRDIGSLE